MGTSPPVIVRPTGTMERRDPHRFVDAYSILIDGREKSRNLMKRDAVRLANVLASERHASVIVERPAGRVQSSYADSLRSALPRRHGHAKGLSPLAVARADIAAGRFSTLRVQRSEGYWYVGRLAERPLHR